MLQQQPKMDWKEALEPQAELIGQLIKPEIFKEYKKFKDKIDEKKKRGEPIDISEKGGYKGYAETSTRYDPEKGIVDENGRILIPKHKMKKMLDLDGIAITV